MSRHVLGIDPGTVKAGFALVDAEGRVETQGIVGVDDLPGRAAAIVAESRVEAIALGRGTHAPALIERLRLLGVPIRPVDERDTTRFARSLYFVDHPPRGWRRLIPLGLQVPPRPVDDYAAILIARRYLQGEAAPSPTVTETSHSTSR